jgi:hypothetical protein
MHWIVLVALLSIDCLAVNGDNTHLNRTVTTKQGQFLTVIADRKLISPY